MRHQEPLELGHAQVDVVVHLQVEVRVHRGHRGAEPHHRLVRQLIVRVRVLQPEKVVVARDFRLQVPVQALVALHGLADHEPEQQTVLRLYLPQRRPGGEPRVSQDVPPRARREPGVHADKRQQTLLAAGFPGVARQRHGVRHGPVRAHARVLRARLELVHGVLLRPRARVRPEPTVARGAGPVAARAVAEPLGFAPQVRVAAELVLQLRDRLVLVADHAVLAPQLVRQRQAAGHLLVRERRAP